ncbi:MAG: diadenylate cyclase CdaA [Lachnospiraceae bacterium]|nr:diadenylate cyclase CdaA [Lachnospiraceae bacterium]
MYLEINIIENFNNSLNVFTTLSFFELISAITEILIIAFIIYKALMWLKNTRAWILLRGIIVIGIFVLLAYLFSFKVILFILQSLSYIAILALIIVFQDDLRAGLEHLGRQKVFSKLIPDMKLTKKISKESIQEIVEAAFAMGKVKTGALIVIEQNITLEECERTGIIINGEITKQLLINIFEKNTPLHDGAVLIVGDVIKAATCYLPLSHNHSISKDLGTRHRAGLGVSEISDSITVIVSEETGNVSICYTGSLKVMKDEKEMLRELMDLIYGHEEITDKEKSVLNTMKEWFK